MKTNKLFLQGVILNNANYDTRSPKLISPKGQTQDQLVTQDRKRVCCTAVENKDLSIKHCLQYL